MPPQTGLTTALLAVAAVGAAHAALSERRGRITHALESEKIRQNLALFEAQTEENPGQRAVLVGNSWLASASVRYRAGLISRTGLDDIARRYMSDGPRGAMWRDVWRQTRGPRLCEEQDRPDREFNDVFERAYTVYGSR